MNWYLLALKNAFDFNGRARRKEYWMFFLFNFIFSIVAASLDNMFGLTKEGSPIGLLSSLYSLVVLIPGLSLAIRRLHDVNKSGWFLLVAFIPLVGGILLIINFVKEGDRAQNQYGLDPKADEYMFNRNY